MAPPLAIQGWQSLTAANIHYLTTVLRLRPGATVYPFDGINVEAKAILVKGPKKNWGLNIVGPSNFSGADSQIAVHIGQGMAPRSRLDWAIEKMTEVGVSAITPIVDFGGTVVERRGSVQDRWLRVATAATIQCGRLRLPQISTPTDVASWNAELPSKCRKFLLAPLADLRLSQAAATVRPGQAVALLVGRTAGLDECEDNQAQQLGFEPVSLGERILRTETVGVVAMSVVLAATGEY